MYTRNVLPVSLLSTATLSSNTSTAVPTAVDMSAYFPVGRREVIFIVDINPGTTSLGALATVTIQECASTATASFTNVVSASGTTLTWTTTGNAVLTTYAYGFVNYRYLRALYVGATSTGDTVALNVTALPIVRAG